LRAQVAERRWFDLPQTPCFAACVTGIARLDLQLTHRCNLRCSYCYAAGPGSARPDLEPALADAAVDLLMERCGEREHLTLELWGGEPFLRPDLIAQVASRARRGAERLGRRLTVGLATNATLLDEAALDLVERHGLALSLSIDGAAPGNAERRLPDGRPAFERIAAGLRAVRRRWPQRTLAARMTVAPALADRLLAGARWLLEQGVGRLAVAPASGVRWSPAQTATYDEQLGGLVDLIAARLTTPSAPEPPELSPLMHRLGLLRVQQRCGTLPRLAGHCGAGDKLVAVDTDGALYPCHRFVTRRAPPAGARLGHVSRGLDPGPLRDALARLHADELRCGACPERGLCGFLCVAVQWRQSGAFDQVPDDICWYNRRVVRAARRLHAAGRDNPTYQRWIDAWLARDPDGRVMEPLARAQSAPEDLLARAQKHLRALGQVVASPEDSL